jgi:hypothetical protein
MAKNLLKGILNFPKDCVTNWHLSSPAVRAWLANGLDELRQVFHPSVQQIHAGNNPGLHGTITTGEATEQRKADKDEPAKEKEIELDR